MAKKKIQINKQINDRQIQWLLRDKYQGKISPLFYKDLRRLKIGEPLDYLIGWKPFLNCQIDLSRRPLIPRPETEYWTEQFINNLRRENNLKTRPPKILDAFAGSGCIGIAILKNLKNVQVDFNDIESRFLKQIKINLRLNKLSSRNSRLIRSDILADIKDPYDFILANPPYIGQNRKKMVQKSVLKYEPKAAIIAGHNGLFCVKRLLKQAKSRLKPNGQIWLEFDPPQKKEITQLTKKEKYQKVAFHRDQYKRWRYAVVSL